MFSFPGAGRKKRVFLDDIANAFNRLPNEVKSIFPGEYELDYAMKHSLPIARACTDYMQSVTCADPEGGEGGTRGSGPPPPPKNHKI